MTLTESQYNTLLKEEVERCNEFISSVGKPTYPKKFKVTSFVERAAHLHRNLIELWGGWRFHGGPAPLLGDGSENWSTVRSAAVEEFKAFERKIAPLLKDGSLPKGFDYTPTIKGDFDSLHGHNTLYTKDIPGPMVPAMAPSWRLVQDGTKGVKVCIGTFREGDSLTVKAKVGQRLSAVVVEILEKHHVRQMCPEFAFAWEQLLQRLGENVWVTGRKISVACTLSCAPSSFLRLGHYGENSCYQNGGASQHSRAVLAVDMPDSFVGLFYRNVKAEELAPERLRKDQKIGGRCWGIALPDYGCLATNFYLLLHKQVIESFKLAVAGGLNVNNPTETSFPSGTHIRENAMFYMNPDSFVLSAGKSLFKRRYLSHYLDQIVAFTAKAGVYTRKGAGPDVVSLSKVKRPSSWPYKEFDLRKEVTGAEKGAEL